MKSTDGLRRGSRKEDVAVAFEEFKSQSNFDALLRLAACCLCWNFPFEVGCPVIGIYRIRFLQLCTQDITVRQLFLMVTFPLKPWFLTCRLQNLLRYVNCFREWNGEFIVCQYYFKPIMVINVLFLLESQLLQVFITLKWQSFRSTALQIYEHTASAVTLHYQRSESANNISIPTLSHCHS